MPNRSLFFLFASIALFFAVLGVFPILPKVTDLTAEKAQVNLDPRVDNRLWFTTESKRQVYCGYGRGRSWMPDCNRSEVHEIQASGTIVKVWHDGNEIYQIEGPKGFILTLEHFRYAQNRAFFGTILFGLFAAVFGFSRNFRRTNAS